VGGFDHIGPRRLVGIFSTGVIAACSLLQPSDEEWAARRAALPPSTTEATVQRAELMKSEAEIQLDPAIGALYECMLGYANDHALAVATPSEIAEASTVACDNQQDDLELAIQIYGYADARAALVARGTQMPTRDDLVATADRLVHATVEDARKRALDIIVRARSPNP
jgi:hypothetical protein